MTYLPEFFYLPITTHLAFSIHKKLHINASIFCRLQYWNLLVQILTTRRLLSRFWITVLHNITGKIFDDFLTVSLSNLLKVENNATLWLHFRRFKSLMYFDTLHRTVSCEIRWGEWTQVLEDYWLLQMWSHVVDVAVYLQKGLKHIASKVLSKILVQ